MAGIAIPLLIPDLWQQEAARALVSGKDVVVHAPTGAGKTLVFELAVPSVKGQAVYTVPTRALANDKFSAFRAKGWDVGLATGDVAHRLDAKILVATLETQKARFLDRRGPRMLVVDEYQMIGDAVRGVNYELTIALAPASTQLLLLSGSVGNPGAVVDWLRRIGRDAVLVRHDERPVPMEEVDLEALRGRVPDGLQGFWPKVLYRALREGLAPVLVFAPRRRAAESLAASLAFGGGNPIALSREQENAAGPELAKLLRDRVAFHHSGLSYAARAGLVEPLAREGKLDFVVATMGLSAGVHFSMRSVLVTDTRYFAGAMERRVEPDELLQMFGRAGRRGLDERGYALTTQRHPGLADARPKQLRRAGPLDWPTLLGVMRAAAARGGDPFRAADDVNARLFTVSPVELGVGRARATGPMPCGLAVDAERARHAKRVVRQAMDSAGAWGEQGAEEEGRLGELLVRRGGRWFPALRFAETLEGIGEGTLCRLGRGEEKRYGREVPLAVRRNPGEPWRLVRAFRKRAGMAWCSDQELRELVVPELAGWVGGGASFVELAITNDRAAVRLDYADVRVRGVRDARGAFLRNPPVREVVPPSCKGCQEFAWCSAAPVEGSLAAVWRALGLIGPDGRPTRRGEIFSFFSGGEGFAIAVALEDAGYPIEDLVFDLANLRAGPRFAGDEPVTSGRIGFLCQQASGRADYPGYLEMGVPPGYGAGAAEAVRALVERTSSRARLLDAMVRAGDLERALIEWRSLLRHIAYAPEHPWERWSELKAAAAARVGQALPLRIGGAP